MYKSLLIAMFLGACALPWAIAEDKPLIEVNALGQPDMGGKGGGVRYFVWYDAAGWHLRTDTGGKAHVFTGTIDVIDGKFTSISNFENLEAGKKKKKKKVGPDLGKFNAAKNQISFKFTTSVKHDGFDFQVDDDAKQIRLKLLIDGGAAPERVLVGPASQPAPAAVLVLPARPE